MAAAYSNDGIVVVTGSWDKTARVWYTVSGRDRLYFHGPDNCRVQLSANGYQGQSMSIFGAAPVLPVRDVAASADWYARMLGFQSGLFPKSRRTSSWF